MVKFSDRLIKNGVPVVVLDNAKRQSKLNVHKETGIYDTRNWPHAHVNVEAGPLYDNTKTYKKAFTWREKQEAILRAEEKHLRRG